MYSSWGVLIGLGFWFLDFRLRAEKLDPKREPLTLNQLTSLFKPESLSDPFTNPSATSRAGGAPGLQQRFVQQNPFRVAVWL